MDVWCWWLPHALGCAHGVVCTWVCDLNASAADFYTPFSFDNAILQRSNLGGLGGRCTDTTLCTEMQSVTQANDLREVRFTLVANSKTLDSSTGSAIPIDLRVTNETEYRAWNIRLNGIKRQTLGDKSGFFGVINLKGPRLAVQGDGSNTIPRGYWNDQFTFVQLRYEFIDGRFRDSAVESTRNTPIVVPRTFFTVGRRQRQARQGSLGEHSSTTAAQQQHIAQEIQSGDGGPSLTAARVRIWRAHSVASRTQSQWPQSRSHASTTRQTTQQSHPHLCRDPP